MIREEFEDFATSIDKNQYSIYKNPNRREMKELVKENGRENVRFIIDLENDNIYVFGGELLHKYAADKLGIKYKDKIGSKIFGDGGYIPEKGKIASVKVKALSKTFDKEDKEWLSRWFNL
jgi:hypothetical protein